MNAPARLAMVSGGGAAVSGAVAIAIPSVWWLVPMALLGGIAACCAEEATRGRRR